MKIFLKKKNYIMVFSDEKAFNSFIFIDDNFMWIKIIIQLYIRISSLPYCFDIYTLDKCIS